eukprot:211229-Rhodomonas_salina.1
MCSSGRERRQGSGVIERWGRGRKKEEGGRGVGTAIRAEDGWGRGREEWGELERTCGLREALC